MIFKRDNLNMIFFMCAVMFLFAIMLEIKMNLSQFKNRRAVKSIAVMVKEDLIEAISYLKKQPILIKICMLTFLLNFFFSSFIQVVIPFIARIQFQVSNGQFGVMNFLFAVGGLLGSILYGSFAKKLNLQKIPVLLMFLGILFLGLLLPISLANNSLGSFCLMTANVVALMLVVSLISIQLIVYIQVNTDINILGRLMSVVMVFSTLATPLGQVLYGYLISSLTKSGLGNLIILISIITLAIAMISKKNLVSTTEVKV